MSVIKVFSSFLTLVSFNIVVLRGRKKPFEFDIVSAVTYSSVILTLRKCLKPELVMKFLEVATHFPPKNKV